MVKTSILQKIIGIMLLVSFIAIGVMAWIGLAGIGTTKELTMEKSTVALQDKTNIHLQQIVVDQAEQSEQLLSSIKNMLLAQEEYLLDAYYSPSDYNYVPQKLSTAFGDVGAPAPADAPADYQVYTMYCSECMISFEYLGLQAKPGVNLQYDSKNDLVSLDSAVDADVKAFSRMIAPFKLAIKEHNTIVWIYFGSEKGVFYGFPGASMPSDYDVTQRDWYKQAVEEKDFIWSEPYMDAGGAGLMITAAKPVYDKSGRLLGVIAADVSINTINLKITNLKIGDNGYSYLIDNKGLVIAKPDIETADAKWDESFDAESMVGTDNAELNALTERMIAGDKGTAEIILSGEEKYVVYAPIKSLGWSLAAVLPKTEALKDVTAMKSELDSNSKSVATRMIVSIIPLVVFIILVSVWFANTISRPIKGLKEAADKITSGEQNVKLPEAKGGDEIAELTGSMAMLSAAFNRKQETAKQPSAKKK